MDRLKAERIIRMVEALRKCQVQYLEACDQYAREGFIPRTCIHGTYGWTDYDNICGGCEEGAFTAYTRGVDLYRYARDEVEYEMACEERRAADRAEMIAKWYAYATSRSDMDVLEFVNLMLEGRGFEETTREEIDHLLEL